MDPSYSSLLSQIQALEEQLQATNKRVDVLRDSHKILVEVIMNLVSTQTPTAPAPELPTWKP